MAARKVGSGRGKGEETIKKNFEQHEKVHELETCRIG